MRNAFAVVQTQFRKAFALTGCLVVFARWSPVRSADMFARGYPACVFMTVLAKHDLIICGMKRSKSVRILRDVRADASVDLCYASMCLIADSTVDLSWLLAVLPWLLLGTVMEDVDLLGFILQRLGARSL